MKTISKQALLRSGVAPLFLGATLLSPIAFAQTPQTTQQAADTDDGEAIVVTGSRIAQPNAISASPVTVIGAEEVRENGYTKIEDLANSLPQVFADQSSGVSNGADGTATINLRGLGASRTLVLIDGRRLMPGGVGGGAGADLNFIPSALISSFELLSGGASSTDGADAVAGVVNFKMNRGFRGVRIDAQYGFYNHKNDAEGIQDVVNAAYPGQAPAGNTTLGGAYDVTLALGTGTDDDRGSIVAYAGYRQDSAITQDNYDYSYCALGGSSFTLPYYGCGGSGTPARTRFGGFSAANRTLAGLPSAASFTLRDNGAITPYSAATDAYNFGPLNYYRRPSKRYIGGAFAEYEINESIKPYADIMFMDYSTDAQIAEAGAFYGPRTVNCDNPFIQGSQLGTAICGANLGTATNATINIGKRNIEGGPRFNDIGFNQFRVVTGVKGDLGSAWSYDGYVQFGKIKVANTYRNDTSNTKIDRALQVNPLTGNCASFDSGVDTNCVPYNVFQPGGITQEAAAYISIPLVLTGTTEETIVSGSVTGDLGQYGFQSPFAEESIKVAFGAEWRRERLETQPDENYINGEGAGQGGPTLPIAGKYSVQDFFGEASLPIVTDKPFFDALVLNLGYRHSSYNVQGATTQNKADTYKIEGTWAPIPDIKFRGSYNRAVRSPNIGELFLNQQVGLFGGSDPCAGDTPSATAAQCALTGVTAAQYGNIEDNSAAQFNQLAGGSLNLRPEKADTWSAGVVLQPQGFGRGLTLSVDYFNIKIDGAVAGIGAQTILDQCVGTGEDFFCDKITRDSQGSLWLSENGFVDNRTTNTGSFKTSGWDINGDYRASFGEHRLRWQFVGTVLDKFVAQPLTDGFDYNCAGFYGFNCGTPNPKFRFNTNLKWTFPNDIAITGRWRYVSSVKVDTLSSDLDIGIGPGEDPADYQAPEDNKLGSRSYFDLLLTLPLQDTITMRMGMNNIFDKNPPITSAYAGAGANGNTYPGVYDYLGRNLFVNITADF